MGTRASPENSRQWELSCNAGLDKPLKIRGSEQMQVWPRSILMVSPDYFSIDYAINPHMVSDNGQLNQVDPARAMEQWLKLKAIFESLNLDIDVIDGEKGLPDMVFCANQMFPFIKDGVHSVILSRMEAEQRQPEVDHFSTWALSNKY